jgi:hypothetical protein
MHDGGLHPGWRAGHIQRGAPLDAAQDAAALYLAVFAVSTLRAPRVRSRRQVGTVLILKQLDLALRGERWNEVALLLRACEPQEAQQALAMATPCRNKFDVVKAYAELKERTKKDSGGKKR